MGSGPMSSMLTALLTQRVPPPQQAPQGGPMPPMAQPPVDGSTVPQAARAAMIGMLGAPVEGQGTGMAITPSPVPAKTLEDWGFDPKDAKGAQ